MKNLVVLFLMVITAMSSCLAQKPISDFLGSLDQEQREKTMLEFGDTTRESWHFFPASMLEKPGVALAELNPQQKKWLHLLLKSYLSGSGYEKAMKIIELENVLLKLNDNPNLRDASKYHITVYGNPEKDNVWGWSFEGHHLSLNFTVVDNHTSFAPRFMGASPATILHGKRKGERALAKEEDLALDLINSLSSVQKYKTIFRQEAFKEILTFTESKVEPMEVVGINMESLGQVQQQLLLDLIYEYISAMPENLAQKRLANIKKEQKGDIYFGWAGATTKDKPHYYRVQGKTFLIEFDNTQNNANHIHSVWRDFKGDFGRDLIREHYQDSSHD